MKSKTVELFPFDNFRGKQQQVIEAIIEAFYVEGYDTVILDAPTGTGKSAMLTTVLRYADDGYYTTPQVSLRDQLHNEEAYDNILFDLKARKDYTCKITGENCRDCDINTSSEQSCAEQGPKCTYYSRKRAVMAANVALITFSLLIVDGNIPEKINGKKVSFGDREVVAVDEAQNLCQQVEEMHSGYKISPYILPTTVFNGTTDTASYSAESYKDVQSEIQKVKQRCEDYIGGISPMEMSPAQKDCNR